MTLRQTQEQVRILFERQIQRGQMSNKLLSSKTRLSTSHVCNFRHAQRRVSIEALARILTALGLELEIVPIRAAMWPQEAPIRKTATPSTPKTPSTGPPLPAAPRQWPSQRALDNP